MGGGVEDCNRNAFMSNDAIDCVGFLGRFRWKLTGMEFEGDENEVRGAVVWVGRRLFVWVRSRVCENEKYLGKG